MTEKQKAKPKLEDLITKYSISAEKQIETQKTLPVLSTGVFGIDFALGARCPITGCGGVRAKDGIEVMAKNGSGKTALAYASMAATMKRFPGSDPIIVAYFSEPPDEDQFARMRIMGVNPDRVIWIGLECSGNRALEQFLELVSYPEVKDSYIDSIAAIPVEANEDKSLEDSAAVGALAQVYNRYFARFVKETAFARNIQLNHYRDPIQTPGRPGSTTPITILDPPSAGGKTKDFLGKARIQFSANQDYDNDPKNKHSFKWGESTAATMIDSIKIKFKFHRNKYAPPLREGWIYYNFKTHKFNNEEVTLRLASTFARKSGTGWDSLLSIPVIQSGSWWTIGKERVNTLDKAIEILENDNELMLAIQAELMPYSMDFFDDAIEFDENSIDK